MEKPIKVSVSIVTYNHEDFIAYSLESILAQIVDFEYEIIIGEDCSTDRTRQILETYRDKYPGKIKLLLHEHNLGVNRNFQNVLENCNGEYIAHLDGDDAMLPGKLQKQVNFLDTHPDHVMVTHDMRVFNSKTHKTLFFFNSRLKIIDGTINDLVEYGTYFCNSSKMYRKSALPLNGIDTNTHYVIDWLLHIQTARHGRIGYIDEVLGEYRKHEGGTTSISLSKRSEVFKDQLYTLEMATSYGLPEQLIKLAFSRIHADLASHYLKEGYYLEFKKITIEGYKYSVFGSLKHKVFYLLRDVPLIARLIYSLQSRLRLFCK